MVVIYENSKMKLRDISVFDGYAYVDGGAGGTFNLPISGFKAVQTGAVNVKMGLMAGEGDVGITGDAVSIRNAANTGWVTLNHDSNSATNFFNSSIFTGGNTRSPRLRNNTGLDISMFNIPNSTNNIIANNQDTTTFRYSSTGDTYVIFNITFAVDAYQPDIQGLNTLTQVNNSPAPPSPTVLPGQNLTYELDITNAGTEAVSNGQIVIPVPYNASFMSANGQYFFTPNSGATPFFNPSLGGNGSIVWNIGNIPLPANSSTVLAKLTYTLKATENCIILNNTNCDQSIRVDGTISGRGVTSLTNFSESFIRGFQQAGACVGEPIRAPIRKNII
jgi:hypothetical protein